MSLLVLPSRVTGGIVGFVAGHLLDDHAIDEVAVLGVARALHHLANDHGLVFVIGRPERDRSFERDRRRGVRRGLSDKDIGRALIEARCAIICGAPTTTVSPLIATEMPNWSTAAASEATSFCCWLQTPPLRTKT